MNLKYFVYTALGILLTLSWACDESDLCLSDQHAIQVGLYSFSTGVEIDTTLKSISVWGKGKGAELLVDSMNVNDLFLPVRLTHDSTEFVIMEEITGSTIPNYDTVLFVYQRDLNYIDGDCGFNYNLILDTIIHTTNIIDSIKISLPNVNYNENLENVKVYIEP